MIIIIIILIKISTLALINHIKKNSNAHITKAPKVILVEKHLF